MNLVDLLIARKVETLKEKCARIKRERRQNWIDEGNRIVEWRNRLGLTRALIARETGVNYSRLRRLEAGLPVKDGKIIYRIYEMTLESFETRIEHERFFEQFRLLQDQ